MTKGLGIVGAGGRMGRAIADLAAARGIAVAGGIGRGGADGALPALAAACSVLIDFSAPDALAGTLAAAAAAGTPVLVGTTGLAPEHHRLIGDAAVCIAVLQAANTSLGITLLARLVEQAARRLGPAWDIAIVEMHHRHKRDAPSGTALLLGDAVERGRAAGSRAAGGTHYASLRGGSVAGDHQVIFAGEGERIELGHRAESRATFAEGALRAAAWLVGQAPGRYTMADVLGFGSDD